MSLRELFEDVGKKEILVNESASFSNSSRVSSSKSEIGGATKSLNEADEVINVCVRIRPEAKPKASDNWEINSCASSSSSASSPCLSIINGDTVTVDSSGEKTRSFTFNRVFDPDVDQERVFAECGLQNLVELSLRGYACTVFAFGQTGSGKTHTITGPLNLFSEAKRETTSFTRYDQRQFGLIQRSFVYLQDKLQSQAQSSFVIQASYFEIYNETLADLLNPSQQRHLNVRWHKDRGFYVENLFLVPCDSLADLMAIIEEGMSHRQAGANNLNEHSTRSHAILTLYVESEVPDVALDMEPDVPVAYISRHGKLTFVDLAGSEKVKDHQNGASGDQLTEANNINRSLLVLGNCISALADSKKRQGHIPFRDSKLTKLLSDSLGGQGVTLMVACLSASASCLPESLNTLRYASRARKIKNKPVVKIEPREQVIVALKREVKLLRTENKFLREQLQMKSTQNENGESTQTEKGRASTTYRTGKGVEEDGKKTEDGTLYRMLQEYMMENENLRSENSNLLEQKERIAFEQQSLSRDNEKLTRKLGDLNRIMASTPTHQLSHERTSPNDSPYSFSPYTRLQSIQEPLSHSDTAHSIPLDTIKSPSLSQDYHTSPQKFKHPSPDYGDQGNIRKCGSEPDMRRSSPSLSSPTPNVTSGDSIFHHQPKIVRNWQRAAAQSMLAIPTREPPKKSYVPITSYRDRFIKELQQKTQKNGSMGALRPTAQNGDSSNSTSLPSQQYISSQKEGQKECSSSTSPVSGPHPNDEADGAHSHEDEPPKINNSYVKDISSFNQRLAEELSDLDIRIKKESNENKREQKKRKVYWPS